MHCLQSIALPADKVTSPALGSSSGVYSKSLHLTLTFSDAVQQTNQQLGADLRAVQEMQQQIKDQDQTAQALHEGVDSTCNQNLKARPLSLSHFPLQFFMLDLANSCKNLASRFTHADLMARNPAG